MDEVYNKLDVRGRSDEIAGFVDRCFSRQDGVMMLDFERILPIPASLQGETNTFASRAARLLRDIESLDPVLRRLFAVETSIEGYLCLASSSPDFEFAAMGIHSCEDLIAYMLDFCPDLKVEANEAIRLLHRFGATNSLTWLENNWGTYRLAWDWYAYPTRRGAVSYSFETAGVPIPIYRELVRQFPRLRFRIKAIDDCWEEFEYFAEGFDGKYEDYWAEQADACHDEADQIVAG